MVDTDKEYIVIWGWDPTGSSRAFAEMDRVINGDA